MAWWWKSSSKELLGNMRIIVFLLIISLVFTSCADGGGDGIGDALGETLSNIEFESGDPQSQSTPTENTNPRDIGNLTNPNNIDYSAYTSLVQAYRKALTPYGDLSADYMGYFYANLIDLNADDVYELVIARVHNSDADYTDELFDLESENFIGSRSNYAVQIYNLDEGNLLHAGEFNLSFYGEEGMRFNIEYAEYNGVNYLVFGGDLLNFGITSSDYVYAKSFFSFNGEYFELEEMFSIQYDYINAGYEPTEYRQAMELVSKDTFDAEFYDKWYSNPTDHTFIAQGFETNTDAITQQTINFLSDFEIKNSQSEALTYSDGNFVLYEQTIHQEDIILRDFLDAVVHGDYEAMRNFTDDEMIIQYYQEARRSGSYYPGLIVEETTYLWPTDYNVQLMQSILADERFAEMYRQNGLENTYVLKVDAKEIIDMQTIQYAGQFGLNVTQYYMYEVDEQGENPKLVAIYDDHFWDNEVVFESVYVTDYEQIFNSYGYEYPIDIMQMYFTEQEMSRIDHFFSENPKEVYFIRNLWGGTIKVYESNIGEDEMYARGELLYETQGDVLYLACSSDNYLDGYLYTDVQIVTEPFEGYEAVYYPAISHPDTWMHLGVVARQMPQL